MVKLCSTQHFIQNSLGAVSVVGLLSRGWSLYSWLLFVFPKSCRVSGRVYGEAYDTWYPIWKYIVHARNGLAASVHPPLDPFDDPRPQGTMSRALARKPISNGRFRGTIWGLSMDREWASNEHGFNHWYALSCCGYCHIRGNAVSHVSHSSWKLCCYNPINDPGRVSAHGIWSLPGVTRYSFMGGDWCHTVEGGICQYLHYKAFELIGSTGCRGAAKAGVPAYVWQQVRGAYDKCGIREELLQFLTGKLLCNDTKMVKCKMIHARYFVAPILVPLLIIKWLAHLQTPDRML